MKGFISACLYCLDVGLGARVPRPIGDQAHGNRPYEVIHFDICRGKHSSKGDLSLEFGIELEMTAPNTSQENRVVERGFATVRSRAIAMMNDLDQDIDLKEKLWAEALNISTYLVNITECSPNKMESNNQKIFGEKAVMLYFIALGMYQNVWRTDFQCRMGGSALTFLNARAALAMSCLVMFARYKSCPANYRRVYFSEFSRPSLFGFLGVKICAFLQWS